MGRAIAPHPRFLPSISVVMLTTLLIVSPAQYTECLQTNNSNVLPFFQGYTGAAGEPARRIHHQHQAIIPSYKFNCCGNITNWGVDLNPDDDTNPRFSLDFQVWRPSPTVNEDGCYNLVNNYIVRSISIPTSPVNEHVIRVTPLPQDQLQFQPGDVLGFYVESHGLSNEDNGVIGTVRIRAPHSYAYCMHERMCAIYSAR